MCTEFLSTRAWSKSFAPSPGELLGGSRLDKAEQDEGLEDDTVELEEPLSCTEVLRHAAAASGAAVVSPGAGTPGLKPNASVRSTEVLRHSAAAVDVVPIGQLCCNSSSSSSFMISSHDLP